MESDFHTLQKEEYKSTRAGESYNIHYINVSGLLYVYNSFIIKLDRYLISISSLSICMCTFKNKLEN